MSISDYDGDDRTSCVYILTINFVGIKLHTSAKIHKVLIREMLDEV